MKKTLKALALALVMGILVISLTGCIGKKIVATRTIEDEETGTYKEKFTATFKNSKVESIERIMEFEDEETAEKMYELVSFIMSMDQEGTLEGMEVKQESKKIIIIMDAKVFAKSKGTTPEQMTKETLRKSLEEEGYTVK